LLVDDDLAQAHRAGHQDRPDEHQPRRQLVAHHLRRGADPQRHLLFDDRRDQCRDGDGKMPRDEHSDG
jgi:hypothetical protein